MKHLDQQLKDYYQKVKLSPERVALILAQPQGHAKLRQRTRLIWAIAASLLLAIGISLWIGLAPRGNLTNRVVAEIARNHQHQGALMVESGQYHIVQAALDKLAYSIQPQRASLSQSFTLVGGKYCSIQGRKAAQLKLRHNASGIMHTLYVWQSPRSTEDIQSGVYESDGVQVDLWSHQKRLFGLARSL